MRVAILTQYYPPEIGAPQRRLSSLTRALHSAGHDVYVLTAPPSYPAGRIYPGYRNWFGVKQEETAKVVRAPILPLRRKTFAWRLAHYFSFVFTSLAAGGWSLPKLDVLIAESPPLFLGIAGALLSKAKSARYVLNVSDLWPDSAIELGVVHNRFVIEAARWLELTLYRTADLISGQSRGIVEAIRKRVDGIPIVLFSNGVEFEEFANPGAERAGAWRADKNEVCNFLYAGLHGLAQGLDVLLDAIGGLPEPERCRFLFVGDGPEREALREKAVREKIPNVVFEEAVAAHDVPALMRRADVVVVSLKKQLTGAVPSKLYEAFASGKPVLLIAGGEAAEIVRRSGAGLVAEPGNLKSIRNGILNLARDPELRTRMGMRGRETARREFNRQIINNRMIQVLERLVGGGAADVLLNEGAGSDAEGV